jgi:large subunit ribosomal protein L21
MSESPATTPTVTGSSVAAASSSVANASVAAASTTGAYAIVEASGQQFWLQSDRYLDLDRIAAAEGETVVLDNVLLVKTAAGTTVGQPYITGATVELKVMAHRRGPKIIIYKMRPKKKTRRKNGHRQELTRVMVQSITVGGKPIS